MLSTLIHFIFAIGTAPPSNSTEAAGGNDISTIIGSSIGATSLLLAAVALAVIVTVRMVVRRKTLRYVYIYVT